MKVLLSVQPARKKIFSFSFTQNFLSLILIVGLLGKIFFSYDGLGRRIQTSYGGNIINYYYDPEVEFLELSNSINGSHFWNLYGPDRSSMYGGAQGIGGLETCYTENTKSSFGIVNNHFGDVVGLVSLGTFTPYQSALGGYGPMLGSSVNQALQPQWRGHYVDPTGFYYLGARYYDPQGGRFISPDPLRHGSSLGLYDYCNGDPVNGLDPDGRCVEGTKAGWANGNGSFAGTYDSSQASSPFAYGLGWTVGGALGDLNAVGGAVLSCINATIDAAEDLVNIPRGSSTAATFMFGPEVGGAVAGLRTWRALRTGAAVEAIVDVEKGLINRPVQPFEVGQADHLLARSVRGDALDIHHVAQAHPLEQVIPGYNRSTAPAISIPFEQHRAIPTLRGPYTGTSRNQLAKDILDLRNYTDAPNSSLQELINLNKQMYPEAYTK